MTIFGIDISSYQEGLDLSRTGAAFVLAKTTEGTYYTDSCYDGWRRQAAGLRLPFYWYHFLTTEDAAAQVANTAAHVGDTGLPGMLDVESTKNSTPTMAHILAYVDAAAARGLHLKFVYLPHWYWQQIGSPDLSPLAARGLHLISSAYPGGSGTPAQIYPGDGAAGWASYGGMTPTLYQFTSSASVGGQGSVDANAFKGSISDLVSLSGAATPTGDNTVTPYDIWAFKNARLDPIDMRQRLVNAEAAAEQARDQANAIKAELDGVNGKLDALINAVNGMRTGGIDVGVLAGDITHAIGTKLAA
jgi:hypothetical protein